MVKLRLKKISIVVLFIFISICAGSSFCQIKKGFSNPILAGFYPDPCICKVGSDYYLVNSTFSYFPGIPVFHSKDLVNWKLIGHVLDRPEQLNLDGLGVSRGIFAPAIRYNKGIFYVTCTLVDGGGNFVVTSTNPAGPWSNPTWLHQVNGIDPCLFFDEDGKTYLLYNSDAPDNKPLYDGHRTIRICEFDKDKLQIISENKILINGGVDISKKPIWIEGPRLFRKDGYYYLTAAEGGTAEGHSQVIFRSLKVDGPYIPYEKNPILTQRNLNPKRNNPITCTGHADFIQTDNGDWWSVFLGCRPYKPFEENYYNTGRETFLAPVKWTDGWPVINPGKEEVQFYYPLPTKPVKDSTYIPYSGNFIIKDDFNKPILDKNWIFLRTLREKWFSLSDKKGFLKLQVRPEKVSDSTGNPSFIGRRLQHSIGYASLSLEFNTQNDNEKAGLLIFQDEKHFYFLCKSKSGDRQVIQLFKSTNNNKSDNIELIATQKLDLKYIKKELFLKIGFNEADFTFYYSYDNKKYTTLKDGVDATFMSIKKAWGFVGNVLAMYATSLGKPCSSAAYFNWFEYRGNDEVYK
jgi:alpha-N-arabinofuranosidase